MNTLETSPHAPPKHSRGALVCRWQQLDERTTTVACRAAGMAGPVDPASPDPIETPGARPGRLAKWISRAADTARAVLLSAVTVAVCMSSVHLVERVLTGPGEAVDLLSGS